MSFILLCLYQGNLKKKLIDANKGTPMTWSQMKDDQSLYDILSTGKSVSPFNPLVYPLSPPLKAGTMVPSLLPIPSSSSVTSKQIPHKLLSTSDIVTTTGIPISDVYKVIPPVKSFEGKQKFVCFNFQTEIPVHHYYL